MRKLYFLIFPFFIFSACASIKSENNFSRDPASSAGNVSSSTRQKKSLIRSLNECEKNCPALALDILKKLADSNPDAIIKINTNAIFSLVYLPSGIEFTKEDRNFLQQEVNTKNDINIIALPFTPASLEKNKSQEWFLDAELELKLSHALGLRTFVKGEAFGGLMAAYLGANFPTLMDKIAFVSPDITRAGKTCHEMNTEDCAIMKSTTKLRADFAGKTETAALEDDETDGLPQDNYAMLVDQTATWAQSISSKSLFIYSEQGQELDTQLLKTFAGNLPKANIVIFAKNITASDTASNHNRIDDFFRSN